MKLLSFPDLRQTTNFDCGATAFQSVLAYYGLNVREDKVIKLLGTTQTGTSPSHIISAAKELCFDVRVFRNMKTETLKKFIDDEIPVIIPVQAWSDGLPDYSTDKNGHYVVAIGYTKDAVIFEDPAIFGRGYMSWKELDERWHDEGADKKKYVRYGIAIYGKTPKYNRKHMYRHMD